ncbi:Alanyl-tRNA synthetase [hydrothermal vent metagenome]|uniref:alanine--tRNA ligase n=1 Tax=hydrothermal vent metagenome TaxID=652676 RepID=A0A3B0VJE0_9ZZZZ
MTIFEVRERYLNFFKKHEHKIIPSSSLIPENDPTTLFTSSGMQPLVPYLLGEEHPKGVRLANSQMCFRAEDVDEIGDNRHTTFFEMLGNWSLGDYFKKEQLPWLFEFLTNKNDGLGLDPARIYVTVFSGDKESGMPADTESVDIWKRLFLEKGIDAELITLDTEKHGGEVGMQGGRIFAYGAKKNWWSRSGVPFNMPEGEPGGPDSEVFYDFGTEHDNSFGEKCHPNCDCGRFIEIGNSVFMQYIKRDSAFSELPKKNVDFGGGLERLTAVSNNEPDIFLSNVFRDARHILEYNSGKNYSEQSEAVIRSFRIILDHMRATSFMIAGGITPSNTEQGYVLRRLIRRSIREADKLGIKEAVLAEVSAVYGKSYVKEYPFVSASENKIREEITVEETKFRKTLTQGLREFEKYAKHSTSDIDAEAVFRLYTSYGFPIELTEEMARERGMSIDMESVHAKMKEHRDKSRVGAEQKFKGGLADGGKETTMLHTCTHLMLAGLRKYLGKDVHQAGSNITSERLRFDFTHHEKVSREILDKVEKYVNEAIEKDTSVILEQIPKESAKDEGVEGSFWEKYPDVVNVYTIKSNDGVIYSKELCGGPHIENTKIIRDTGKHFKIMKESSSSAGVRRIKAVLTKD